jgi:glycosyltransferase involved in cell wall biosynthesis
MSCGTPVLSSRGGSLPEALGNAAVFADSFDAMEWASHATRLLSDRELRKDLVSRGFAHASNFTWRETARKTLDVYRSIGK